ncbi:MAG: thermonuclease family protein [Microgenomates group bacterium]
MSFKQKFSITLVVAVFTLLITGILYSYQYEKSNPSKTTSKVATHVPPRRLPNESEITLVTRIIDGDTFQIETKQKVRLIGIDTPELNKANARDPECFGIQAAQQLSNLILNKKVRMEKDISETDRFGRLLRYVYLDNTFINQRLVESGYAFASTYPPDIKFKDTLSLAQKTAQENKLGLWNECKLH